MSDPKHDSRMFGYEIGVIRWNCIYSNNLSNEDAARLEEISSYIKTLKENEITWDIGATTMQIRNTWLDVIAHTLNEFKREDDL